MELSADIRAFLENRYYATLATINRDGTPQLSVVWYELQGEEIMLNTAAGRVKEQNLRRDPRISLCIEAEGSFVTLSGTAALNDDQSVAHADIHRLAVRYDGAESAQRQMATFSKQHRVTLRMPIERVHAELDY